MKRITVTLPETLHARLRLEARRRRISISHLTCEAIEAHLEPQARRSLLAAKTGRSGQGDVSERIEEILAAEL